MLLLIQRDFCKSAILSFLRVVRRCCVMGQLVVPRECEHAGVPNPIPKQNTSLYCRAWTAAVLLNGTHVIRSLSMLINPPAQTWLYVYSAVDTWIFSSHIWRWGSSYGQGGAIVQTDVNVFDVATPFQIRFHVQQEDIMFPHKPSAGHITLDTCTVEAIMAATLMRTFRARVCAVMIMSCDINVPFKLPQTVQKCLVMS